LNQKIGILGGGQLGKMLLQAGSILDFDIRIMEQDADCPAASLTSKFHKGKITDYQDVVAFGEDCDIVTIEIENVNIQALAQLESSGKKVYPSSFSLGIIKDKREKIVGPKKALTIPPKKTNPYMLYKITLVE